MKLWDDHVIAAVRSRKITLTLPPLLLPQHRVSDEKVHLVSKHTSAILTRVRTA